MSDKDSKHESAEVQRAPSRFQALAARIVHAAIGNWRRSLAMAVTFAGLVAGLAVTWTYTARLAIDNQRQNLADALEALDAGNYERARSLVRQVLSSGALPRSEYGAPLFILGAVKTYDAGTGVMPEQRRTEYLVASRYLKEARSYGFVPQREKQGLLLLGKSLVESVQIEEAIEILTAALEVEPQSDGPLDAAIHRVLAEAYTLPPRPNVELALQHVSVVLDEQAISPDQRVAAQLLKAKVLGRLNRFGDAIQALASLHADGKRQPAVLVMHGQLLLDGVDAALERLPVQAAAKLPPELSAQVDEAVQLLQEARSLDRQGSEVTRRSLYLLGRSHELKGDLQLASQLYLRTLQQYSETPEGLAATLAEADLLRQAQDDKTALGWYRRVLDREIEPASYRSEVLPLERLRERILAAVGSYVERGAFADAITLLDRFPPLFTRTQELKLRGETLRRWGDRQLEQSAHEADRESQLRQAGMRRLREAGVAFERLAALRFATTFYITDVWESADCFYRGQSYSNAARLLDVYLKHEPEKRNAQALLRLGQANLALGRVDESIQALEECIELYERDNATYQARIDCAKAYWFRGDVTEAEHLLRVNLTQSTLKPKSPEWKDSFFALGQLFFEQGRYEEAINTLEEAVERYPDDPLALESRYLTGEAYRRWAAEPLERLAQARTDTERTKYQQLVDDRLTRALEHFKAVQSSITLKVRNVQDDPIYGATRRNCYMLEGAVLFDLGRYSDAIEAYQNVSSLYPNEPFVLETFVQIAHCWQRLDRAENAQGAIEQARLTLDHLPSDAEFAATTAFSREEWQLLLNNMSQW